MKSELIPKKVKIQNVFKETDKIFTLTLDVKGKFSPGQFVQISLLGVGECPISVASYSKGHLKLTIRKIGRVTKYAG